MNGFVLSTASRRERAVGTFMEHASMKRLLSTRELCALLTISRSTLWRRVRDGEVPRPVEVSPGRRAYLSDEIERWIEARKAARGASS